MEAATVRRPARVAPPRANAAPARRAPARKSPAPVRRPGGHLIPIAVGTASAVGRLPDSGLMVRLTRGRAWIGVLGVLLTGIVALNVITLSFAAATSHHGVDPFSKHLTPDQRDATITAFRAAIAASVALCLLGSIVAYAWLPGAPPPHREQEPVVTPA